MIICVKMLARLSVAVLFFGMLLMGIFSKRGFLDWQRMERQNSRLRSQTVEATSQKESLENRVRRLKSDTREQERIVRQVLGYVRNSETVVEF